MSKVTQCFPETFSRIHVHKQSASMASSSAAGGDLVLCREPDPKRAPSIYSFSALDVDGRVVSLGDRYRGKVCVVVNVASK